MQISRHWRLNAQRYRLEGVRYEDGQVALQEKTRHEQENFSELMDETVREHPVAVKRDASAA